MSYTLSVSIALGSSKTGLTLTATILDTAGATVSTTGSGFVEIGLGNYLWTGSLPDNHRGAVKFTGTGVVALAAINTEEAEMVSDIKDILVSQTPGAGEYTVDLPISDGSPIEGAEVWVTATNSPTAAILRATTSDSLGNARFYLDAGSYYYWVGLNGYETLGPVAFSVP